MTYQDLMTAIMAMSKEQQLCEVTVLVRSDAEYLPMQELLFAGEENDQLDEDHPILTIE